MNFRLHKKALPSLNRPKLGEKTAALTEKGELKGGQSRARRKENHVNSEGVLPGNGGRLPEALAASNQRPFERREKKSGGRERIKGALNNGRGVGFIFCLQERRTRRDKGKHVTKEQTQENM